MINNRYKNKLKMSGNKIRRIKGAIKAFKKSKEAKNNP